MLRGRSSHWVVRIAWLTGKLLPLFESEKSRHLGSGWVQVLGRLELLSKLPTISNFYPSNKKKNSGPPLTLIFLRRHFGHGLVEACPLSTIMSLEVAHDLSIQDLLYVLNRKLVLEYIRVRKTTTPHADPVASLESEVSTHQLILIPTDTAGGSHSSGLHRSTVSKIVHAMF